MAKQYCKDCLGTGVIVTRGPFIDGEDWCETCDATGTIHRTGPYRLADGTWSDGVDRSERVKYLAFNDANPNRWTVHRMNRKRWEAYLLNMETSFLPKSFPTHAEAIAYADRMARTNQGETK